jgi:hypothetical protein
VPVLLSNSFVARRLVSAQDAAKRDVVMKVGVLNSLEILSLRPVRAIQRGIFSTDIERGRFTLELSLGSRATAPSQPARLHSVLSPTFWAPTRFFDENGCSNLRAYQNPLINRLCIAPNVAVDSQV